MNNGCTAGTHKRQEFDRKAWDLRMEGKTQAEIAARLGVTQSAVSRSLKRISSRLNQEFILHAETVLALHTERLNRIHDRAMSEWERSREDLVTLTEEDNGGLLKTVTSRRNRTGDPALLAQAMAAMRDVRRLWGLESMERRPAVAPPVNLSDDDEEDADGDT
jgi:transcriptional regulator with XRE-family HTH domain